MQREIPQCLQCCRTHVLLTITLNTPILLSECQYEVCGNIVLNSSVLTSCKTKQLPFSLHCFYTCIKKPSHLKHQLSNYHVNAKTTRPFLSNLSCASFHTVSFNVEIQNAWKCLTDGTRAMQTNSSTTLLMQIRIQRDSRCCETSVETFSCMSRTIGGDLFFPRMPTTILVSAY